MHKHASVHGAVRSPRENGENAVMPRKPVIYISCGIFKEEIEYLVREKQFPHRVIFLDAALHVNFDRLKESLVDALERHRAEGAAIKVLYGHCHPEIKELLERYGATKLPAGNCLEAFVGHEEVARLNREATSFFLSAGWVNNWEKIFDAGKRDFGFDFKSLFKGYKRILVLDTGVIPVNAEKVQRFSAFTGLPVERRSITLDHFLGLLENL
jgi:uncharacterized protein DUF1638